MVLGGGGGGGGGRDDGGGGGGGSDGGGGGGGGSDGGGGDGGGDGSGEGDSGGDGEGYAVHVNIEVSGIKADKSAAGHAGGCQASGHADTSFCDVTQYTTQGDFRCAIRCFAKRYKTPTDTNNNVKLGPVGRSGVHVKYDKLGVKQRVEAGAWS